MDSRKAQILEEISQLFDQYKKEVPGRRSAWPESIKNRVEELRKLGLNYSQISRQTNLPYFTVLKWHSKKVAPAFRQVSVVQAKIESQEVATVTDPTFKQTATVTVTLPSGVRIEGATLEFLLALLFRLEAKVG